MLKPLTSEQTDNIIKAATEAFADEGFEGANINRIARTAGVSVGVIYKYYSGKRDLFSACVKKSLDYLDEVFSETEEEGGDLMDMVDSLITRNQEAARLHPEYFRLYHQITMTKNSSGGDSREGAEYLAELIVGRSARLNRRIIETANKNGDVRKDINPSVFAFFFDNMMMMLHFAYTCDYYEERFRVYCGREMMERDSFVHDEMMRFLQGAFEYGGPEEDLKEKEK